MKGGKGETRKRAPRHIVTYHREDRSVLSRLSLLVEKEKDKVATEREDIVMDISRLESGQPAND